MIREVVITALLIALSSLAQAANFVKPEELKEMFLQKKDVIIIDIQPAKEFEQHYFKDSIETNAFPVKSPEEKTKLDKTLTVIKASKAPVVIVCPRGKGGAKNSYEYLLTKGVPEEQLLILEGGIAAWPFKDYLKQGR